MHFTSTYSVTISAWEVEIIWRSLKNAADEEKEDKREIDVLRVSYVQTFINDLREVVRYKQSSSFVSGKLAITESYDGVTFTEVNDLNTARNNLVAVGADNTSSLAFGGAKATANATETESWNGTNWTEVNDLNTGRNSLADSGTVTAALAFGGATSPQGQTEVWNGTNWPVLA